MSNIRAHGRLKELRQRDAELTARADKERHFDAVKPAALPPEVFDLGAWFHEQRQREAADTIELAGCWRIDVLMRRDRLITLYARGTYSEVDTLITHRFRYPFSMMIVPDHSLNVRRFSHVINAQAPG